MQHQESASWVPFAASADRWIVFPAAPGYLQDVIRTPSVCQCCSCGTKCIKDEVCPSPTSLHVSQIYASVMSATSFLAVQDYYLSLAMGEANFMTWICKK